MNGTGAGGQATRTMVDLLLVDICFLGAPGKAESCFRGSLHLKATCRDGTGATKAFWEPRTNLSGGVGGEDFGLGVKE